MFAIFYLQELNLMTYDFHGSWNTETGANAPLYDMDGSPQFSVHGCVVNWSQGGGRPDQINIAFHSTVEALQDQALMASARLIAVTLIPRLGLRMKVLHNVSHCKFVAQSPMIVSIEYLTLTPVLPTFDPLQISTL